MDFCRQASLFLGLLNDDFCIGDVPGLKQELSAVKITLVRNAVGTEKEND